MQQQYMHAYAADSLPSGSACESPVVPQFWGDSRPGYDRSPPPWPQQAMATPTSCAASAALHRGFALRTVLLVISTMISLYELIRQVGLYWWVSSRPAEPQHLAMHAANTYRDIHLSKGLWGGRWWGGRLRGGRLRWWGGGVHWRTCWHAAQEVCHVQALS